MAPSGGGRVQRMRAMSRTNPVVPWRSQWTSQASSASRESKPSCFQAQSRWHEVENWSPHKGHNTHCLSLSLDHLSVSFWGTPVFWLHVNFPRGVGFSVLLHLGLPRLRHFRLFFGFFGWFGAPWSGLRPGLPAAY